MPCAICNLLALDIRSLLLVSKIRRQHALLCRPSYAVGCPVLYWPRSSPVFCRPVPGGSLPGQGGRLGGCCAAVAGVSSEKFLAQERNVCRQPEAEAFRMAAKQAGVRGVTAANKDSKDMPGPQQRIPRTCRRLLAETLLLSCWPPWQSLEKPAL